MCLNINSTSDMQLYVFVCKQCWYILVILSKFEQLWMAAFRSTFLTFFFFVNFHLNGVPRYSLCSKCSRTVKVIAVSWHHCFFFCTFKNLGRFPNPTLLIRFIWKWLPYGYNNINQTVFVHYAQDFMPDTKTILSRH